MTWPVDGGRRKQVSPRGTFETLSEKGAFRGKTRCRRVHSCSGGPTPLQIKRARALDGRPNSRFFPRRKGKRQVLSGAGGKGRSGIFLCLGAWGRTASVSHFTCVGEEGKKSGRPPLLGLARTGKKGGQACGFIGGSSLIRREVAPTDVGGRGIARRHLKRLSEEKALICLLYKGKLNGLLY